MKNNKAPERIWVEWLPEDDPIIWAHPKDADCQEYTRADLNEEYLDAYLPDAVEDKLSEMNKDSESFDKELWVEIKGLLNELDFDWRDHDNSVTASDAREWLDEYISSQDQEIKRLEKQIEQLKEKRND